MPHCATFIITGPPVIETTHLNASALVPPPDNLNVSLLNYPINIIHI